MRNDNDELFRLHRLMDRLLVSPAACDVSLSARYFRVALWLGVMVRRGYVVANVWRVYHAAAI
jgi:hypothetical protein